MYPISPYGSRFNSGASIVNEVYRVVTTILTPGQTVIQGLDVPIEMLFLSGAGETINSITGGRNGYLLYIIANTANITITHNASAIWLNSAPAGTDLVTSVGDILALVNRGGNPTLGVNGYWQEFFRTMRV